MYQERLVFIEDSNRFASSTPAYLAKVFGVMLMTQRFFLLLWQTFHTTLPNS